MKTGRPRLEKVQGYYGRPMCCAVPMQQHVARTIKRDQSISQRYCCGQCRKVQTLYFKADGTLHNNQQPRMVGLIKKRSNVEAQGRGAASCAESPGAPGSALT